MWQVSVVLLAAFASPPTLQQRALEVLRNNCSRCHGGAKKFANLNITDPASLGEYIEPGKPEESRIIELIEAGKMPVGGVRVAPKDVEILREWIAAGAKMPALRQRRRHK
jgi:hypothetical protein